jgi:hypothetical protein
MQALIMALVTVSAAGALASLIFTVRALISLRQQQASAARFRAAGQDAGL